MTWNLRNLMATKNSPLTPLKQHKIHWSRKEGLLIWSIIEMIIFLFKWNSKSLHIYIQNHLEIVL